MFGGTWGVYGIPIDAEIIVLCDIEVYTVEYSGSHKNTNINI